MTERALTAEEREKVERIAGIAEPWIAGHNDGDNTARLEAVRARHYAAITALVRENGDLRAQVAWLERQDMTVREVIPPAQAQALKDAEAALARMREAMEGACVGADFMWGDPPIPVLVFAMRRDKGIHAKMTADELVGAMDTGAARALAEGGEAP